MYEAKCDPASYHAVAHHTRWRRVPYLPARVLDHKRWLIRSSTTVWRKCSASLPGRSGRAESDRRSRPVRSQVQTPSGKWREFKSELSNGHRAAGIQPEAESKLPSICLRRTCSLACTRSLSTSTGCRCSTCSFISILFRTEKGISENDLVKVSMAPVKLSCGQSHHHNVPKFLVMWRSAVPERQPTQNVVADTPADMADENWRAGRRYPQSVC